MSPLPLHYHMGSLYGSGSVLYETFPVVPLLSEFKDYVTAHETDIIRFKAKVLLDDVRNDPHNRIEAINSVVSSIAHIPDPVSRDVYVQECSLILGIPEATIAQSVAIA